MAILEPRAHINSGATVITGRSDNWGPGSIVLFRFAFVFFILQAVPLDWKYYRFLFEIRWNEFNIRDLFYLAKYTALLLLYRKSASIGASLAVGFTGNVLLSNLAYNGGETIYCLYLLGMALVIFAPDAHRYYSLLILARPTPPNSYRPIFLDGRKSERLFLKSVHFTIVFFLGGYLAYASYANDPFAYTNEKGLRNTAGLYDVGEFQINGKTLPYAFVDSTRWQNVVFEEWPTISVGVNRKIIPDNLDTEEIFKQDHHRIFESTGSNGRSFYSYEADTVNHVLKLHNRNRHYPNDMY